MAWEIEYTAEFDAWFDGLTEREQEAVYARVTQLSQEGPQMGGSLVTPIEQSRHHRMKELRVNVGGSAIRVLFIFDPRRVGILLLGGDKAGEWGAWYDENVPRADMIYDRYLQELKDEGLL